MNKLLEEFLIKRDKEMFRDVLSYISTCSDAADYIEMKKQMFNIHHEIFSGMHEVIYSKHFYFDYVSKKAKRGE